MAKSFVIPQDPEERKKILKNMRDISDWKTMTEAHRDKIKSTINAMYEEYEIPKKLLNEFAKQFHKDNQMKEAREINSEFQDLVDALVPPPEGTE